MQVKYYVKIQPKNMKAGFWVCVSNGFDTEREALMAMERARKTAGMKGEKQKISTVAGDEYP